MKKIVLLLGLLLIMSVSALEINSPKELTYNTTSIVLDIEHNESANISFSIDDGLLLNACTDCNRDISLLDLIEGEHTIDVIAHIDNVTYEESVNFVINLSEEEEEVDFNLDINSPDDVTYDNNDVTLEVESDKNISIWYELDGNEFDGCDNCSEYDEELSVEEGNHTIIIYGQLEGLTKSVEIEFNVNIIEEFTLEVLDPDPQTYEPGLVPVKVKSNVTLDELKVEIESFTFECEDCDEIDEDVNLTEGDYTLTATGTLDDITKEINLDFKVEEDVVVIDDDEEDDDDDGEPRFTQGLNKLPQMIGQFTDGELASIIRSNSLNPGVVNRLIKTGMLGEESIDAILEMDFAPKGVWQKLLGWFGFRKSYAHLVYEKYDLSQFQKKKMVTRDDLPRGLAKKISVDIVEEEEDEEEEEEQPVVQAQNTYRAGWQIPPGQAKKGNFIPPGLAKNTRGKKPK